ncbi:MAG: hypothetical protein WCF12_02805 [Propionicimonas sp.]
MTESHPNADQLVELALLDVEPAEQQLLAAHLAGCADCRTEYAALDDSLQQALAATPAIAPPAGFSGRVLDAMGMSEVPATPLRQRRWRSPLLVAAAVLVGLLVGIGSTLALIGRAAPSVGTHTPDVVAAALVTSAGDTVGSAGVTQLDGRDYLVVSVTRGRANASYECFLVGADGQRASGGSWKLSSEYGADASGAWAVPLAGERPVRVELVAPSGKVWSQAQF